MNTTRLTRKRIKVVAFLFVVSLVAFSGTLMAKARSGADLVVMKTDGDPVRGELIAVKQHSLLLMEWQTHGDVSVNIKDVRYIKFAGKSHAAKGALIGLLAGGAFGAVAAGSSSTGFLGGRLSGKEKTKWVLLSSGLCAGLGVLIGATVGQMASPGNRIQIEGESDAEINAILEDLRARARIPYFQ